MRSRTAWPSWLQTPSVFNFQVESCDSGTKQSCCSRYLKLTTLHGGAFYAPSTFKGLSGHETLRHFLVRRAAQSLLTRFYAIPPQSTELELLSQRNEKIRHLYHEGWTISDLSRQFNLSAQRIYQIIKRRNH
jgi:hypothetical protein